MRCSRPLLTALPALPALTVGRAARRRPCRRCYSTGQTLPSGAIIFSGIQPTGVPHLGNYLGALQRWVQLQEGASATDPKTELYFAVADLHALTTVAADSGGGTALRQRRRETLAALLAVGLDPERCVLFYQSAVPAHAELMWLMSCTASMGYLSRMTQWKSKLQLRDDASFADDKARAVLKLGLFSYPVLQAADVLIHRATHVPVGEDQSQHLEFARECATNFNHVHGTRLVAPKTLLCTCSLIRSMFDLLGLFWALSLTACQPPRAASCPSSSRRSRCPSPTPTPVPGSS